jgi:hypothetical protein
VKQFVCENGHSRIPTTDKEGRRLQIWLSRQTKRTDISKEELRKMKELTALAELHPQEVDSRDKEEKWMDFYNQLKRYKDEIGTRAVSQREYPRLFDWVKYQRRLYRLGKLSAERKRLLEQIKFQFIVCTTSR